jgi:hypothetical protein
MSEMNYSLDNLCLMDGSVMAFQAERMPEAVERDGPDRTLSAEAMDGLFLNIKAWIGSRMIRSMDKFDHPPQRIDIVVAMTIDGEPAR